MKTFAALFVLLVLSVPAQTADAPARAVLSAPSGRFVFGQTGNMAIHHFMLDTATGRLWQLQSDKDEGLVLVPVIYRPGYPPLTTAPLDLTNAMTRADWSRLANDIAEGTAADISKTLTNIAPRGFDLLTNAPPPK